MNNLETSDGQITFGDVDLKYMASNFSFFPVSSNAYWEIEMQDIEIGKTKLNFCEHLISKTGTCGIAVDTGTSLIAGPTKFIDAILSVLNVKEDCSNFDTL